MNNCPKCIGFFSLDSKFCETHQREYDAWLNKEYVPDEKCENGHKEWIRGTLQMTDPPIYPEKEVFRCSKCNDVRLERDADGNVRIMDFNE